MISRIESGQRITTIGGLKGTVKAVDETTVVITVNGHGTEMTFENQQLNKQTLLKVKGNEIYLFKTVDKVHTMLTVLYYMYMCNNLNFTKRCSMLIQIGHVITM